MPKSQKTVVGKFLFEKADFDEIRNCTTLNLPERLSIIAGMIRCNSLTAIMCARSGHIGASLSIADTIAVLYHQVMRVDPSDSRRVGRDIFILSKGHAAPTVYAALASRGVVQTNKLLQFRRLGGLEGHADMSVPGVDANTGSLGMGISKAKGYALAYKSEGIKASVFVMAGDGELQEGQNWEAIQSAGFWKLDNLYLIIDRNRIQTDMKVDEILDISPLCTKLRAFGWYAVDINGHCTKEILNSIEKLKKITSKPKAIIANTLKGKGVSFMEHPQALRAGKGLYKWHDKLPSNEEYALAWNEIILRTKKKIEKCKLKRFSFPTFPEHLGGKKPSREGESLVEVFSESLVEIGKKQKDVVVLDADLAESCGLRKFQRAYPEKFIEVGIAEQDMVSMAGGLALAGKLPIVNTFASFLTSRANEQIFNNASEGTKIIYVGHLAGILPAKPGKSHQAIRDISLLKAIPNMLICQPCNGLELRKLLNFLVHDASQSGYLRLEHSSPRRIVQLPEDYEVKMGQGATISRGTDAVIFGYGALLLSETLLARDELKKNHIDIKIVDLPWLNHLDNKWVLDTIGKIKHVFCVENHSVVGGQSEELRRILMNGGLNTKFHSIGVEGYGRSGENEEILEYYGMDSSSIANRIRRELS